MACGAIQLNVSSEILALVCPSPVPSGQTPSWAALLGGAAVCTPSLPMELLRRAEHRCPHALPPCDHVEDCQLVDRRSTHFCLN